MNVLITGVPVRHWLGLQKPARKLTEAFLDSMELPYQDVNVQFFGSFGDWRRLTIAVDADFPESYDKHLSQVLFGLIKGQIQRMEKEP